MYTTQKTYNINQPLDSARGNRSEIISSQAGKLSPLINSKQTPVKKPTEFQKKISSLCQLLMVLLKIRQFECFDRRERCIENRVLNLKSCSKYSKKLQIFLLISEKVVTIKTFLKYLKNSTQRTLSNGFLSFFHDIFKYAFHACSILLITLLSITLSAQTEIPCDLVELSNKALGINPTLLQNKNQIQIAEGGILVQQGAFNPVFLSGISYQENHSNLLDQDPRNELINNNLIETQTLDFSLGLQKTFRNGLFSTLSVDYADLSNSFPLNQFNQNVEPFLSNHTFSSTLALTQPLLRGGGIQVATALEKAAMLRAESAQNNYQNESAFQLLQIAIAYWQYTAAHQNWLIYKENEDRVANVLRITKELVKADKKPAGDLVQIQADLANQQRLTNTAFQNFQNAKINLGRAVGLSETESEALSTPLNTFPEIRTSGVDGSLPKNDLLKQALTNRKDLQAFQKEKEALIKQIQLAANNRSPELDLTGFVSYGGTNFGNGIDRAFSAITNKEGSNYTVGVRLNLSLPIRNQTARGNYLQQKTALDNQEITTDNLERNISLNVNIAVTNVENSASILKKAKETLTYSQEVFTNEQIKFKNGLTTLLNLILFQERLTFAQLEYQQAQLQFAVAIANLRYETGTLITFNDSLNTPTISKQQYYTVPKL